jgi:WhiB family redox-sensing transcriptional regulator
VNEFTDTLFVAGTNTDIETARTGGIPVGDAAGGGGSTLRLVDMLDAQDVADEQDWQERALCAQTDPEAFFPEKGGSTREAKRICSGCEVRAECLEYALAQDERFGIWGGLSERERRRLRRGGSELLAGPEVIAGSEHLAI